MSTAALAVKPLSAASVRARLRRKSQPYAVYSQDTSRSAWTASVADYFSSKEELRRYDTCGFFECWSCPYEGRCQ